MNSDQNRRRNSYTNADFVYEIFHSYTKSWNSYTNFVYDFMISYTKFVYEGRDDISSIRNVVSQNFVIRIFHSYTKSDLGSEFVYEILFGRRNRYGFRLKSISPIDEYSSPFGWGAPDFVSKWDSGDEIRLKITSAIDESFNKNMQNGSGTRTKTVSKTDECHLHFWTVQRGNRRVAFVRKPC